MVICVPVPALSHLRPSLRLVGPARPVIGLQGRRAAPAAERGRRAAAPLPASRLTPQRDHEQVVGVEVITRAARHLAGQLPAPPLINRMSGARGRVDRQRRPFLRPPSSRSCRRRPTPPPCSERRTSISASTNVRAPVSTAKPGAGSGRSPARQPEAEEARTHLERYVTPRNRGWPACVT